MKLIRKIKNEINTDRAQLALDDLHGEPIRSKKRAYNQTVNMN